MLYGLRYDVNAKKFGQWAVQSWEIFQGAYFMKYRFVKNEKKYRIKVLEVEKVESKIIENCETSSHSG